MKALLFAVLLSVLGASAFADHDNGAFIIDLGGETCKVPDGDFNVVHVTNGHRVATLSKNNNMLTSCWGRNPEFAASDGEDKEFSGFKCTATHPVMGDFETRRTHATVSSSGSVQMKCHFNLGE